MGFPNLAVPEDFRLKQYSWFLRNDFTLYVTAGEFTTVVSDSGTVAAGDADGGVVILTPSDGSVADNDEAYIRTTNKIATFAAAENLYLGARLQFTEAATSAANIFFGCASAIAANTLVDDGAGMLTNFSGACIYKVDGSLVWKCISSNGTTQTISTSTATAGSAAAYQELEIHYEPFSSTQARISFWQNGSPLIDSTTNKPIVHLYTFTSAAAMYIGAGSKNGSANQQTLNIDRIDAQGRRIN